jgi:hypothetical protein
VAPSSASDLGHGLGTLLAQRQVVLAAAALVGVALDGDALATVGGKLLGVASTTA